MAGKFYYKFDYLTHIKAGLEIDWFYLKNSSIGYATENGEKI